MINNLKKIAFFLLICFAIKGYAQIVPHNHNIAVNKFKQFYNSDQPDSIFAMFGPEMKTALPLDKFKISTAQLRTQLGNLTQTDLVKYTEPLAVYKATFKNGVFSLNLSLNSQNKLTGLALRPYQEETNITAAPADPALNESAVSVKTLSGSISGTLAIPKNATRKIPVILIIAGSGPIDRDGNSPKLGIAANDYKLLASDLGKNGIATLRYDKRMVGQSISSTKESELHFDDYVDDAVVLIDFLSNDQRFSKIIVLGHSEGSLVGMLAVRDEPVKGYISVAGAGDSADKIVTDQLKSQPQWISDGFKVILDSLKKGKFTPKVDPALYFVARPDIQPYLLTWFRFNPQKEIRKVKIPTLILQGTTDLQVKVEDAEKLKKGKSDATLVIIKDMNHVLKEAPADKKLNMATYSNPALPLKPELVTSIVEFINKLP